jgi:hypothetical protein
VQLLTIDGLLKRHKARRASRKKARPETDAEQQTLI